MVSSSRQAIACILLILSASIHARSQSAADKGPTSTITGKVTLKGKGVPGVGVSLTVLDAGHPSTTRHRGVTDDEGNYKLTNVPPGSYTVTISAPGFASADRSGNQQTLILNKGETVENVDFALVRGGVITGRVTDRDGNPIIEEEVYVTPVDAGDPRIHYRMGNAQTDDRGIYRIFGLGPGSYKVAAGQQEGGFGGMRERAGYRRTYYPDAAEASAATVIDVKEGGEVSNIDITVGRAIEKYSASGRIVDGETGRPLANIPYGIQMFIDRNSSSSMTNGVVSNGDGEFKWPNLAPGKYAIFFQTPPNSEWRADPVHFEVIDRNITGLIARSTKGGSASGVLVLEGTNDKAVYANLINSRLYANVMNDQPDRGTSPSTTINPDGSFRVGGLQAGVLSFGLFPQQRLKIVRIERDGVAYSRGVEIKDAEQLTGLRVIVAHANGTIRGVVKLQKGTAPADGHFGVSLRRVGENEVGPYISYSDDQPQVDTRGQFVAEGLLPGTYEVNAMYTPDIRIPWRSTKLQVVVSNGAVTNVTITIDPDAAVLPGP